MSVWKIQNENNGMYFKSDPNVPAKYTWTIYPKDASILSPGMVEDAIDLVRAHEGYAITLIVSKFE